jgi:hypothetical protein
MNTSCGLSTSEIIYKLARISTTTQYPSSEDKAIDSGFVLGRSAVLVAAGTPAVLTEGFSGFNLSSQANTWTVHRSDQYLFFLNPFQYIIH